MAKRKPHLNRYRRQLRDALLNPSLTDEQRAQIKAKLDMVGKPKVYGGKAIAPPAEATPEAEELEDEDTEETASSSLDDLLVKTKDELLTLAADGEVDVKTSWSKTRIAEAILASRGEN